MLSPGSVMTDSASSLAVFFGGKRVGITSGGTTTAFKQNRLGSNQGFQFYPYGEARGTPPADTVGFATYTRDSATGLDYADQRYYASNFGRFMSPDPYLAKIDGAFEPRKPQTWNHYAYVVNDPINLHDPSGLDGCSPEDPSCNPCDPSVDPFCTPITPPPYEANVTITCDIRVFANPIPSTKGVFYHAYVEDILQIAVNGTVVVTDYEIFQAQPQSKTQPGKQCSPLDAAIPGRCWLNDASGPPTVLYGSVAIPPTATPGKLIYDSLPSQSECFNMSLGDVANFKYRNNKLSYNALVQNSNTWVYNFLLLSGLPMPLALGIGANALVNGALLIGWGIVIPWF